MHIVIVGPFPPYRGGIAHFNERMAKHLQNAGHKITAINFRFQYPGFLFPGTSQTEEVTTDQSYKNLRLIHSVNPQSWFSTASEINKFRPDIVIFRYWLPFMAPALGTIARRLNKNIRKIALTDNVLPHEKRLGDKALTRWFLKPMNGYITLSEAVAGDLKQFDNTKPRITLFHPLYDQFGEIISKAEARKALNLPENDRIILFFGFIRGYKGLDLLLDALATEHVTAQNVRLLVAGEYYDAKSGYQQKLEKLGDRVIEHDHFIPSDEVNRYFCAADCVVQPYKTATQSGVTQIAYHFGRPMIVTNVSGLPEIVPHGECGFVVSPDAGSLSEAIARFYEGNKESVFSRNVAEQRENFSWKRFISKLEKWLETL